MYKRAIIQCDIPARYRFSKVINNKVESKAELPEMDGKVDGTINVLPAGDVHDVEIQSLEEDINIASSRFLPRVLPPVHAFDSSLVRRRIIVKLAGYNIAKSEPSTILLSSRHGIQQFNAPSLRRGVKEITAQSSPDWFATALLSLSSPPS